MTVDRQIRETKLVAAARAMLSMQVGLSVGALRIVDILAQADGPCTARHGVFAEFLSRIPPGVPLGTARLYWAPAALLERDAVLAGIEAAYRARLMQECMLIIRDGRPRRPSAGAALPAPAEQGRPRQVPVT